MNEYIGTPDVDAGSSGVVVETKRSSVVGEFFITLARAVLVVGLSAGGLLYGHPGLYGLLVGWLMISLPLSVILLFVFVVAATEDQHPRLHEAISLRPAARAVSRTSQVVSIAIAFWTGSFNIGAAMLWLVFVGALCRAISSPRNGEGA